MSNEWVSAAEALKLTRQVMSLYDAPRAICTRAREGLIAAKAVKLILHGSTDENVEVPKEFWWAGGESALEQNWSTGDFETWIDSRYHLKAFGVSFARSDIEAMIGPALAARAHEQSETTKAGGRPAAAWWDDLWIELCRQLWTGDLKPNRQSDIEKAMLDWATAHGHDPGISTIRPRARKLWTALDAKDEN